MNQVQTHWVGGVPAVFRSKKPAMAKRDKILCQLRTKPLSINALSIGLHINSVRVGEILADLVKEGLVESGIGARNATVYWSVQ